MGTFLPGAIRRQRWSALNVPLIWGAASHVESLPSVRVVDFSNISSERNQCIPTEGKTTASGAVRICWAALGGSYSFLGREFRSRIVGLARKERVSNNTTWVITSLLGHKNTFSRQGAGVDARVGPAGIRLSDVDVE